MWTWKDNIKFLLRQPEFPLFAIGTLFCLFLLIFSFVLSTEAGVATLIVSLFTIFNSLKKD